VETVTLPREERCGAILLAELIGKILPMLKVEINSVHLWTDSTIVWSLNSPPATRWNILVTNIVARIQETTNVSDWKHVPTLENPADFFS
jgi:hypothetical protein